MLRARVGALSAQAARPGGESASTVATQDLTGPQGTSGWDPQDLSALSHPAALVASSASLRTAAGSQAEQPQPVRPEKANASPPANSRFGGAAWVSETGHPASEFPDEGEDTVPELPESPYRKHGAVPADESGIYPSDFEEEDTKDSSF